MSGHSKWSTIKRKKAITDAKRSKIFGKMARAITIAARKGADPTMNPALRTVVDKARGANMSSDNIERAIKKGAGSDDDGTIMDEITYEAYGPGGVALLIEAITDNKNRIVSEIKHILTMTDGKFANAGSVAWLFDKKGVIRIINPDKPKYETEMIAIESGADDIFWQDDTLEIYTPPENFDSVKNFLVQAGLNIQDSGLEFIAKNSIEIIDEKIKEKIDRLYESLEKNDDVQQIYLNIS